MRRPSGRPPPPLAHDHPAPDRRRGRARARRARARHRSLAATPDAAAGFRSPASEGRPNLSAACAACPTRSRRSFGSSSPAATLPPPGSVHLRPTRTPLPMKARRLLLAVLAALAPRRRDGLRRRRRAVTPRTTPTSVVLNRNRVDFVLGRRITHAQVARRAPHTAWTRPQLVIGKAAGDARRQGRPGRLPAGGGQPS